MGHSYDVLLQLQSAEDGLISAASSGDNDALNSIALRLESVNHNAAVESIGDADILSHIYKVASSVSLIANGFMDIESEAEKADSLLASELAGIFKGLRLDGNPSPSRRLSTGAPSIYIRGSHPVPSCPASQWLVKNLHNPYPPASAKKSFASRLGCTVKSVDDWFTNARRKIGWAKFLKCSFGGRRFLALDCAHRVLVEGTGRDLYGEEIIRNLEDMKIKADRLYGAGGSSDSINPGTFAKEFENDISQAVVVNNSRQRRPSRSSTISEQSSTSRSATSSISSRKRSRAGSEESDTTLYPEYSDADSYYRPLKRGRFAHFPSHHVRSDLASTHSNVPSPFSSPSKASSITVCSAGTDESSNEPVTPGSSPTLSKIPLEFFNGWMDDLSAESAFLPHDLADNPPLSVLSRKRDYPELHSDGPSKRACIEEPHSSLVEMDNAHNVEPNPSGVATQSGPASPSPLRFAPYDPVPLRSSGEATTCLALAELDNEEVKRIITQLDFNIPEAPVSEWSVSLLNGGLETSIFDFSSFGVEIGSSSGLQDDLNVLLPSVSAPDAPLSVAKEAVVALYGPQHDVQSHCFEPFSTNADSNTNGPSGQHADSVPLSLSALDFDFLEALGNAPQSVTLDAQTTICSSPDSAACLVDIGSYSEADELKHDDSDRAKKLERLDQLLVEAQKLQKEVFG